MSLPMPPQWTEQFPRALVIGAGVYARTLAEILGTGGLVTAAMLEQGLRLPNDIEELKGKLPVWSDVSSVLLLWETGLSQADVIWRHLRLWELVKDWTERPEFHEISWIVVLSDPINDDSRDSLQRQLSVHAFDGSHGYSLWERSSGLGELLNLMQTTPKTDLQTWHVRQRGDAGRMVLAALHEALSGGDFAVIKCATDAAWTYFESRLIQLDFYCHPPCHPNGHAWRGWLRDAVTRPVTPDIHRAGCELLPMLTLRPPVITEL